MSMTQEGPASFVSNEMGTPAVTATGNNAADGVRATNLFGVGVLATRDGGIGIGVSGFSSAIGVQGRCDTGTGVFGQSDTGDGVFGIGVSTGTGVKGESGSGSGVWGTCDSGAGVKAESVNGVGVLASSDGGNGVDAFSVRRSGVRGSSVHAEGVFGDSDNDVGVKGFSINSTGVFGQSDHGIGVKGESADGLAGQFDGNVQVYGDLSVSGTKAFVQAHPTDPEREIVYIALEGGEAGTYVRGSGQLQSGKAVLALPEHFGLVTENSGLTVQLTPRGQWLQLYVVELDTAQLVVREAQGKSGVFDYLIQGVRRGSEPHEVIRTKR